MSLGQWRLSPAYDLTYIINTGGYLPDTDHCMYVRAKLRDVTLDDAIQFARDNGIRRPESIIRQVADVLQQFRTVASKNFVREEWIGRVETTIKYHLTTWGLIATNETPSMIIIDGVSTRQPSPKILNTKTH